MTSKQTRWFLVSNCGINFPLHQTMISLGKEGCDIVLQSRSVDKRHALVTFDHYERRFKVKDLNSFNGLKRIHDTGDSGPRKTYLNEKRIPSQTFVKLEHLDTLRFGFDVTVYQIQEVVEKFPVPVIPDYRLCSWKVSPYSHHSVKMSECKGCLQKQTIQHTCRLKDHEWGSGNPSPTEEVRLQPSEGCSRPISNSQNEQICAQMPTDKCGNFFPRSTVSSDNNPPQHMPGCCLPQIGVISQHQSASEDKTTESKKRSPEYSCSSEGNFTHHLYSVPQTEPHSRTSYSCNSCVHVSSPSDDARYSTSGVLPRHSENILPNTSKNVGCSSNTSLQSTFSGDSLDITLDENAALKNCPESKPPSFNLGALITKKNAISNVASCKNVMEAEKPLDASMSGMEGASIAAVSRPICTAFTIEFDDDPITSKKLDIKDSISKFAPPKLDCETKVGHRKNVLELFSDENGNCSSKRNDCTIEMPKDTIQKTEEREEMTSPTLRIVSAAKDKLTKSGMRKGGYHSDGHGSSDQEGIDEISAKSDPARKSNFEKDYFEVVGLPIKFAERKPDSLAHKPNGTIGQQSLPVCDLKDSAKYLINKMFGEISAPTNSPTEPISPTILSSLQAEKRKTYREGPPLSSTSTSGVMRFTDDDSKGIASLDNCDMFALGNKADERMSGKSRSSTRNRWEAENDKQIKKMVHSDREEYINGEETENWGGMDVNAGVKQDDNCDNVSEAGTYTIESDQKDAKEETQARTNIDNVFGIDKSAGFKRPELGHRTADSAPGKRSNNGLNESDAPIWLKEWVARSVLESNDVPTSAAPTDVSVVSARHQQLMQASVGSKNSTNESIVQRQRRRLPTPPVANLHAKSDTALSHTRSLTNVNDKMRASSSSTSPDGRRSDSSIDTETILKDTENVVSAMEARMDYRLQLNNSGESEITSVQCEDCKDSGGESDVDTSTASGANDAVMSGTYRKNSRQMVMQANTLENDDHCSDRSYRKNRAARECYQGRKTPTGEFGGNYSEGESASVHSDISSSSEVSGSSPVSSRKCTADKKPLMRFNRAFSLRRARLDCDSDGTGKHSPACTKTSTTPAVSRPSSSSSVGSSKEGLRRMSNSNRSDSGGSTMSAGAQNASSGSFERSDGGRFSLRLSKGDPAGNRLRVNAAANNQQLGGNKGKGNVRGKSAPTPRSNSTLSSKELEMKNWKRRKEYDPLKAAAEGRKKDSATAKTKMVGGTSTFLSKSEMHSPISTPFTRSVSFHGTDGLNNLRRNTFTLDQEVAGSPSANMVHSGYSEPPTDTFSPIHDLGLKSRTKKSSEDECTSETMKAYNRKDLSAEYVPVSSPRGSPLLHPVHKHKSKIDALDNLVISTINQVSGNLRGKAEEILKKLSCVHHQECAHYFGVGGLTDLLERMANGDSPDLSPQACSVSRQLSCILKNMKCLEESMQAIHKVLDSVIQTDDSGVGKLNGKLKSREDAQLHRAALNSRVKEKQNSRHVKATL